MEEWHIPRKTMSTLLIATTDHAVTEQSMSGSLTAVQEEYAVPLLHMSTQEERMSGHFRQVIVDVAGMLVTPIRLQNNCIYLLYWSHDQYFPNDKLHVLDSHEQWNKHISC